MRTKKYIYRTRQARYVVTTKRRGEQAERKHGHKQPTEDENKVLKYNVEEEAKTNGGK